MTNYSGLGDAELAWYSPSDTYRICLNGLEHSLGIHSFRPTWLYQIVEVLVTRVKFLEPFGYCIVINWNFLFCTKDVFVSTALWLSLTSKSMYGFKITHRVKQCVCQRANYHHIIAGTYHGLNCIGQVIYATQTIRSKILQNFWLTLEEA